MPERQLGEVPERPASKVLVEAGASALHGHVEDHLRKVVSRMVLACVTDPALGDQRLVPASAVADAVRAERERVERAVRGFDFAPDLPDGDELRVADMNAARDRLAGFIAALPPADGNTKEEG